MLGRLKGWCFLPSLYAGGLSLFHTDDRSQKRRKGQGPRGVGRSGELSSGCCMGLGGGPGGGWVKRKPAACPGLVFQGGGGKAGQGQRSCYWHRLGLSGHVESWPWRSGRGGGARSWALTDVGQGCYWSGLRNGQGLTSAPEPEGEALGTGKLGCLGEGTEMGGGAAPQSAGLSTDAGVPKKKISNHVPESSTKEQEAPAILQPEMLGARILGWWGICTRARTPEQTRGRSGA